MTRAPTPLERWFLDHGRHELAWRHTTDRWHVLVAEIMLAQTQVARVEQAWPEFIRQFPTPQAAAQAGPGAMIIAWGRLGYPRRARRLYDAAVIVAERGWPHDLSVLPGVGRYTAGAVRAEVDDDPDAIGIDVNIRRVCERVNGETLSVTAAERTAIRLARPLRGRDRLLALMDLGALVCTARAPTCHRCPLRRRCATQGVRDGERTSTQGRYEGSFRQRRGVVLARLRAEESVPLDELDAVALSSLVDDGLAVIDEPSQRARLPAGSGREPRGTQAETERVERKKLPSRS